MQIRITQTNGGDMGGVTGIPKPAVLKATTGDL
jgi:hypothetical protein